VSEPVTDPITGPLAEVIADVTELVEAATRQVFAPDPLANPAMAFIDPAFIDPAFIDPALTDPALIDPALTDPTSAPEPADPAAAAAAWQHAVGGVLQAALTAGWRAGWDPRGGYRLTAPTR
jgi:serine/threonine-protein kinase